ERSHGAVSDQLLIAVSKTNMPEYVERSTACEQQMVSFALEGPRFRTENASGQVAIACVEIRERIEQAGDVGRRAVMNDVEIKGRDRRAREHGGDATHDDEVDVMASENLKRFF